MQAVKMTSKQTNTHIQTSDLYEEEHFVMAYNKLLMASHWISPEGDKVKLSHNIKAIYHYRLSQYRSFTKEGKHYIESVPTVAKVLAVSEDVSKATQALLIKMGLMVVSQKGTRVAEYTVFPLKYIKGSLINDKLTLDTVKGEKKKKRKRRKVNEDANSWKIIQAIEHNKKQIDKIKQKKEKVYILTEEDMRRLRESGNKDKE